MKATIAQWDPKTESYQEFQARQRREKDSAALQRRVEAVFKLALSSLDWSRYAFGVEHGMDVASGPCRVHSYVVCKDCYRDQAGHVDPRTIVGTSAIRALFPDNEALSVGMDMAEAVRSMINHEQIHHASGSRARG